MEKSQGVLKVKRFSFSREPEQEAEVHKQINQYLKLKKTKQQRCSNHEDSTPTSRRISEMSQSTAKEGGVHSSKSTIQKEDLNSSCKESFSEKNNLQDEEAQGKPDYSKQNILINALL